MARAFARIGQRAEISAACVEIPPHPPLALAETGRLSREMARHSAETEEFLRRIGTMLLCRVILA